MSVYPCGLPVPTFLEHGTLAADKDAFLAVALHIHHGHDVYRLVFLLEFLYYYFGAVGYFLVVVEEYFLAYYFGDEETRGLVGERVFTEVRLTGGSSSTMRFMRLPTLKCSVAEVGNISALGSRSRQRA